MASASQWMSSSPWTSGRRQSPGTCNHIADADFGELLPRPAPEAVAAFYDVEKYYTHGRRQSTPGAPGVRSLSGRMLRHLAWRCDRGVEPTPEWWTGLLGATPCRVLEIGCGDGGNLTMLRALGHRVVGVEPDPAARARALDAGLDMHADAGEALPEAVRSGGFDAVIFMHALEHCLEPETAIANARALLKPGGLCVAETPNNACRGARAFGAAWCRLDAPRHLNFFTDVSLKAAFERQGFDVVDAVYRYVRQFSANWIAVQTLIAQRLGLAEATVAGPARYWAYLTQTALAPARRKYDSVRLVCRRS